MSGVGIELSPNGGITKSEEERLKSEKEMETFIIEEKIAAILVWKLIALCACCIAIIFIVLFAIHFDESKTTVELETSVSSVEPVIFTGFEPITIGQWESVIPENNGAARSDMLGMQTVHSVLLPSGKIMLIPGSSWRNINNETEFWPNTDKPAVNKGLFDRAKDPFHNNEKESYYNAVNNAAIYNPATNEFFRIPHPVPVDDPNNTDHFVPSDQFCSGQIQLPNGNALWIGGTQYYYPYRTAHNAAYIWDWITDSATDWESYDWTIMPNIEETPWTLAGLMPKGRWYPNAVPLMDGRLVIVGGFVGFQNISTEGAGDMYSFEINTGVDFFDYRQFDAEDPQRAWRNVDVSNIPNSPFATALPEERWTAAAYECEGIPGGQRQCDAYKFDAFKLYPRMFLLPDGHRIFFTRDGDYNSLRTGTGEYMRNTNFTYIMDVGTSVDDPSISFEMGPELPRTALSSGTAIRDPNNNRRILVCGGMANGGGTLGPGLLDASNQQCNQSSEEFNVRLANQYFGSAGSQGLITYRMPSLNDASGIGSWIQQDQDETFLPEPLTMHYLVILPNRQLLAVGGGRFDFAHGVREPALYTYNSENGRYDIPIQAAQTTKEHLYHNTALLLGDGRVFLAGGNANRATLDTSEPVGVEREDDSIGQKKYNPDRVDTQVFFFGDGYMGSGVRPAPAEEWTAEIYSPPYLFIDPDRRAVISNLTLKSEPPSQSFVFKTNVADKTHYLFHSNFSVEMKLLDLPTLPCTTDPSVVLIKLGAATHGWDSGQRLHEINFYALTDPTAVMLTLPSANDEQIVPGFYHLFYNDCRGKPSVAVSVRFDDNVQSIN